MVPACRTGQAGLTQSAALVVPQVTGLELADLAEPAGLAEVAEVVEVVEVAEVAESAGVV